MDEREAGDDDIKDCPNCLSRESLVIRWIPSADYKLHEATEVGCSRCGTFFTADEDRFSITDWNRYVIEENKLRGRIDPHEQMYSLLSKQFEAERNAKCARAEVDAYLETHIAPTCPFSLGDRFVVQGFPGGVWSTQSVRAVYGTNTGPFWILGAQRVSKIGLVRGEGREFWEPTLPRMKKLLPFWKPNSWAQVFVGDECLFDQQRAQITQVDRKNRLATVRIGEDRHITRGLLQLRVPLHRVED